MDILEVISEKTTAIALALVVMYFYNKLVEDMLRERKDIIETLRSERKEWQSLSSHYINTLFEMNGTMLEAIATFRGELHQLRGKLTEFLLRRESEEAKGKKDDDKA